MKIVPQSVSCEFITTSAAQLIEAAGRTCYKSENKITPDSAKAFVAKILASGHHSVIEHAYASFRVVCDRGVSHEFVRHRLMSYSQESTRYCNYSKAKFGKEITVIEPPGLEGIARQTWEQACERAEIGYFELLAEGVSPQIARSVLPTCLKTELVATANFREWRHFLRLRMSPKAHPQMRQVASMIAGFLMQDNQVFFADIFDEVEREEVK